MNASPKSAPRILLLGAGGQVGFELHRSLAPLGEVLPVTREGTLPGAGSALAVDLSQPESLVALLDAQQPDIIVNAAAYTAVDRAESEPEAALAINAQAPETLAQWCAKRDALLVHYSTDYVFDGTASRPYREDDDTAPLGVYGRSKLAGEEAIRASGAEHLILRTAWVYAARGHNFLRTMLRLGREREMLRVVADQRGSPVPARWLAAATAAALARGSYIGEAARSASGTYHLAASGETSWHEFAVAILARAHAAGFIERIPQVQAIATAEYPAPARRPAYSRLDSEKFAQVFGLRLPDWRVGLEQTLGEI